MADVSLPPPRYSLWQAINVALTMGLRALEEVRMLAPEVGKPGPAGLGFDDLTIEHDGERTFTFRLAREGIEPKVWTFELPAMIYRGVFREGGYARGDVVTHGGSLWHCDTDTEEKPGEGSKDWKLAIKRGADGANAYRLAERDGFQGSQSDWLRSLRGPPGPEGRPGKDLTQMDHSGRKW